MLDSGSSVSLLHKDVVSQMKENTSTSPSVRPQLVTASGDPLHIVDCIPGLVMFDKLKVVHNFIVVSELIMPALLGVDFLEQHGLVLNFSTIPLSIIPAHHNSSAAVSQTNYLPPIPDSLQLILNRESKQQVLL